MSPAPEPPPGAHRKPGGGGPGARPRAYVRPDAIEAGRVRFDAAEAHHLVRVLRLGPGATVEAIDGRGRLYVVRLGALARDGGWGTIEASFEPRTESPCAITLAPAVLKGERMDWLVQKATELGVARIAPVETARSVARPRPGAAGRTTRWARIAREAVKQCGRVVVPTVVPPRRLAGLLAEEAPRHAATWLFSVAGGAWHRALPGAATPPPSVLLLVGPEGGFTPEELAVAERSGARVVSLGPRILRAESAGIVAVALCQYLFGDLSTGAAGCLGGVSDA